MQSANKKYGRRKELKKGAFPGFFVRFQGGAPWPKRSKTTLRVDGVKPPKEMRPLAVF